MSTNEGSPGGSDSCSIWPRLLLLVLVAAFMVPLVSQFVSLVMTWIASPFELENAEGVMLTMACDIKQGYSVYPDSLSPRAFDNYTPLYSWLTGLFADCSSPQSLLVARLISLVSTLGCVVALGLCFGRWVKRPLNNALAILMILGITLSEFGLTGSWYFLGRIDMFAIALAFFGLYVLSASRTEGSVLAGGVLLALAAVTKQSFLIFEPFIATYVAYAMVHQRQLPLFSGRAIALGLRVGLLVGLPSILMFAGLVLGGGKPVLYYLFTMPMHHGVHDISFWMGDLLGSVAPELAVTLAYVTLLLWRRRFEKAAFIGLCFIGLVAMCYPARRHDGGYINVVLPLIMFVSACAVAGVLEGIAWVERRPQSPARTRGLLVTAIAGFCLNIAAVERPWGFEQFKPAPSTLAATESFIALAHDHTVLFSNDPQINLFAGSYHAEWGTNQSTTNMLRYPGHESSADDLVNNWTQVSKMTDRISAGEFDIIVLDGIDTSDASSIEGSLYDVKKSTLCSSYRYIGQIDYPEPGTMRQVTGATPRPSHVFVRSQGADALKQAVLAKFKLISPLDPGGPKTPLPGCAG